MVRASLFSLSKNTGILDVIMSLLPMKPPKIAIHIPAWLSRNLHLFFFLVLNPLIVMAARCDSSINSIDTKIHEDMKLQNPSLPNIPSFCSASIDDSCGKSPITSVPHTKRNRLNAVVSGDTYKNSCYIIGTVIFA